PGADLGTTGQDTGDPRNIRLEESLDHRRYQPMAHSFPYSCRLDQGAASGGLPQSIGKTYTPTADGDLGWGTHSSFTAGGGLHRFDQRENRRGTPSRLRAGTQSGGIHLGTPQAARDRKPPGERGLGTIPPRNRRP